MVEKHVPYSEFHEVCNKLKKARRQLRQAKDMFWKQCKSRKYDQKTPMCEFMNIRHFVCNKDNRSRRCPFYAVLKD